MKMTGFKAYNITGHCCSREGESKTGAMADQVMAMEPELRLCLFVECCSHLANIHNFLFL
jgi:hypothetical protein